MTLPKATSNSFNGEMRVQVNKRIYPTMDEGTLQELVQRYLEGEDVPGIRVVSFEVRDEDRTDEVADYVSDRSQWEFASQFITGASVVETPTRNKTREEKS